MEEVAGGTSGRRGGGWLPPALRRRRSGAGGIEASGWCPVARRLERGARWRVAPSDYGRPTCGARIDVVTARRLAVGVSREASAARWGV